MRRIEFITDDRYADHVTDAEHPEIADRVRVLRQRLAGPAWQERLRFALPRAATRAEVLRVHNDNYLLRLEETCLSGREWFGHTDNKVCYDTYVTTFLAAGAGLTGIDLLEKGDTALPFCAVRPPGHHAEPSLALGFCFLNNVAIAARYWQQQYGRQRIFIIDWDAHHGNGIQEVFEQDPDVFYVSIHEHPTFSFPGTGYAEDTGSGPGRGATLNIPLTPGAGRGEVMQAIDRLVEPAINAFAPEAIIVAAGFDGHVLDDMSGLAYPTELYEELGKRMMQWARRYCHGRLLTLLEGGYHLDALAAGVEAYLTGIQQTTFGDDSPCISPTI
ncbi:MAG: histone deacetylase [Desulfobulbaceae bacterium A2]|nr:MAG: histone deacetylase [Desulfobulbaceae bacterium A2]